MKSLSRRKALPVLALVAIAALMVALPGAPAGAAGPVAAKKAHVSIKNFLYKPKTLKVKKGTRVAFTNKDGAKHTATKKGVFNTGKIKHGKTVTIKFKKKGTFKYVCTLHPFMHGKIVVK